MHDPNLDQLIAAADALRPLLPELVFVGGCVTGLLITDAAAAQPRRTIDVDAIAEITSYAEYAEFGERLRSLGFNEDTSQGAPVCRWIRRGTILDVMPLDESILGFSNRWYKAAMKASAAKTLHGDLAIRMVTAPYFVATKLDAFKGRGGRHFLDSRDLEDVISVVDGREALATEVRAADVTLGRYVRREIARLLADPAFLDALPGFLLPDAASQSRIGIVLGRLRDLSST